MRVRNSVQSPDHGRGEVPMAKAKRIDQELFDRLRKSGLRKSVARQLASAGKAANDRAPDVLRRTVSDLTDVLGDLEKRVPGRASSTRSQAAQKAARTRKRAATRRSTAAKKGAATRARSSGSRATSRSSGSRTTSRSSGSRSTSSRRRTGTSRSR